MLEVIVLNVTCVVFIDANIYADDVVMFVHCWNVPFSNACIWMFPQHAKFLNDNF